MVRTESVDFHEKFGAQLPTVYELVSNEYDYQQQSSYSFDLNSDAGKYAGLLSFMFSLKNI